MRSQWQPTKLERRVQGIARQRAMKQLLRIPWKRFQKAYEEYPRWEALALWVRAVVDTEGIALPLVMTTLEEQCPSFLEQTKVLKGSTSLGFSLQKWIHERVFASARHEGWLDALVFYGVRSLRSQSTWAYWERCEEEWDRKPPSSYLSFKEWVSKAQDYDPERETSIRILAGDVERYVEWSAFSCWLALFASGDAETPKQVAAELEQKCPGFLERSTSRPLAAGHRKVRSRQQFMRWIEDQFFAQAKKEGRLDAVRQQSRAHPLYARMQRYCELCNRSRSHNRMLRHPSFDRWRSSAENYTES
jgi:hypothetical protein